MKQKHLIVFGEDPDQQIRKNLQHIKSYKEAQWLYDGILYQDDWQELDIDSILFRDPKFAPDALIDNGKWISPKLFGHNQSIWQESLRHCFAQAGTNKIHCFTFMD